MITPDLAEVLEAALANDRLDLHVGLPGRIQSFDAVTKTATVEIMLKNLLVDEDNKGQFTEETLAPLQNVPVEFSRTSKFFTYLPVEAGDTGMIFFSEAHTGQFKATGKVSIPDDIRRHGLSGAVFHPGGATTDAERKALPANVNNAAVFGEIGGNQLRIDGNFVEITKDGAEHAADFVALAGKVDKFIDMIDGVLLTFTPIPLTGAADLKAAYALQRGIDYPIPTAPTPTAAEKLKAD